MVDIFVEFQSTLLSYALSYPFCFLCSV